jgi:HAMP domain-containing protein
MGIFGSGRRKQIVVDRQFQVQAAIIGAIYILAVATSLVIPLFNMVKATNILLEGHSEEMVEVFRSQQQYTIISLVVFFVSLTGAWVAFTLWRTHKVAGPVVKITRFIHEVAAGNFSHRITLRTGDELQALASALNVMTENLEERERTIREELHAQIQAARTDIYNSSSAERSIEALDRLNTGIDHSFHTRPAATPQQDGSEEEDLIYS